MTREEMLKDLEYLVTEGELEYFETLSVEDLKRQYDDFFDKFEGYKSSEELETEEQIIKANRGVESCKYCPPYRGDNAGLGKFNRNKKHGVRKPKYKNKRI